MGQNIKNSAVCRLVLQFKIPAVQGVYIPALPLVLPLVKGPVVDPVDAAQQQVKIAIPGYLLDHIRVLGKITDFQPQLDLHRVILCPQFIAKALEFVQMAGGLHFFVKPMSLIIVVRPRLCKGGVELKKAHRVL